MVVFKWSNVVEVPRVKLDGPLSGGLYKVYYGHIVTWPGMYPDANMDCLTWSIKSNDWVVPGDLYNKKKKLTGTYP